MHYFIPKKSVQIFYCLVAIVILCILSFWDYKYHIVVNTPTLSEVGGVYEDSFYLSMDADEGDTIYYTLDGSIPNEQSIKYTQPILVDNATVDENTYSMRMDTSVGFRVDLIDYYKTRDKVPGYVQPDYLLDKCTIIRAIAVSKYGSKSDVVTESYFVNIGPENYDGCNIISIVTDPSNLFDSKKGIYVTGETFDKYLENGELDENWRFWDANYTQRGKEWERDAFFQVFDKTGNCILSKNGGIRTRGGVSRGTLPRGLNLYAREEYDGNGRFDTHLFDSTYNPASVSLASGGNQIITQFSDYMITERTSDCNYALMSFEPYVMFLNGEYWGFYWMTEKFDAPYIEHYYGIRPENVVMIKNSELEIGNDKDIMLYYNMKNFIQDNDMSVMGNYEKACELIDIDSFLDYYATMIYIARSEDWPNNNFAIWRAREVGKENYADGKWRWMMFDCNSASMRDDKGLVSHDTLTYVIENDKLFASLWNNASFRKLFQERVLYIADNCFNKQDMNRFIEDYNKKMIPILTKSWARFYGYNNNKMQEYQERMESYRIFFMKRKETVDSWFVKLL